MGGGLLWLQMGSLLWLQMGGSAVATDGRSVLATDGESAVALDGRVWQVTCLHELPITGNVATYFQGLS